MVMSLLNLFLFKLLFLGVVLGLVINMAYKIQSITKADTDGSFFT